MLVFVLTGAEVMVSETADILAQNQVSGIKLVTKVRLEVVSSPPCS